MTPFCSLKQNCNTLLVQFCYSKQLKAVKNGFGVKQKPPWEAISGCVSGNPGLGSRQPIWISSVYLHLTFGHQSIKLTSFVCLSEHCARAAHIPSHGPLDACPCFFPFGCRTCPLLFPSIHKMLQVTLTICSPLPWHHCWQKPHSSSHHGLKPEQQQVEWLPDSFPSPSGWGPWVQAQFSSIPDDLFLSRHHRLYCMGSVHVANCAAGSHTH